MTSHGACTVSFVETTADILGCELNMTVATDGEDLRWPHVGVLIDRVNKSTPILHNRRSVN